MPNRREALQSMAAALVAPATGTPAPPPLRNPAEEFPHPGNCRRAERIVEALWPLLDACSDYLRFHEENDCGRSCSMYPDDTQNDVLAVRHIALGLESFLNGELLTWPASARREALKARRRGDQKHARFWDAMADRETADAARMRVAGH